MLLVVLGLCLFLLLLLISVRLTMIRERTDEQESTPVIHASGVYSIVRSSPRELVLAVKPPEDEIRKYLAEKNEDTKGNSLSGPDKERLVSAYAADLDANLAEIEAGDREDVEFYYYEHAWDDSVCEGLVSNGQFVTREDLYTFPRLVPPFHLGCACRLKRQHVNDEVRKTIAVNMRPLLVDDKTPPKLPNWHAILKLPQD